MADQWRFAQYYLPGVPLVAFNAIIQDDDQEATEAGRRSAFPGSATALAWFEPELDGVTVRRAVVLRRQPQGIRLRILHRAPGEHFWVTPSSFGVAR